MCQGGTLAPPGPASGVVTWASCCCAPANALGRSTSAPGVSCIARPAWSAAARCHGRQHPRPIGTAVCERRGGGCVTVAEAARNIRHTALRPVRQERLRLGRRERMEFRGPGVPVRAGRKARVGAVAPAGGRSERRHRRRDDRRVTRAISPEPASRPDRLMRVFRMRVGQEAPGGVLSFSVTHQEARRRRRGRSDLQPDAFRPWRSLTRGVMAPR